MTRLAECQDAAGQVDLPAASSAGEVEQGLDVACRDAPGVHPGPHEGEPRQALGDRGRELRQLPGVEHESAPAVAARQSVERVARQGVEMLGVLAQQPRGLDQVMRDARIQRACQQWQDPAPQLVPVEAEVAVRGVLSPAEVTAPQVIAKRLAFELQEGADERPGPRRISNSCMGFSESANTIHSMCCCRPSSMVLDATGTPRRLAGSSPFRPTSRTEEERLARR